MTVVRSKNNVPIRLNEERWFHITEEHSEMAGYYFEVLETVENPEAVYEGKSEECIAIKEVEQGKYIVAVYRESSEDGFVITAFLTRRKRQLDRRRRIWPR